MPALAARAAYSAWRMSGRRSSSAEGRPAGTSGGGAWSERRAPRATGPGFLPTSTLIWFSLIATCLSRSGILDALVAIAASALAVSRLERHPALELPR